MRDDAEGAALAEVRRRWGAIFDALAGGGEAPPALRLRAEGMMEALALLELATAEELQDAMAEVYEASYGEPLPPDWRELFPFPQVPGFGRRAPVYPSAPENGKA